MKSKNKRDIRLAIISVCILPLFLNACSSKDKDVASNEYVVNGVAAVVNANFSLSLFNYGIQSLHYDDTLSKPGPFTLLAPSNTAFNLIGYNSGVNVIKARDSMQKIIAYSIIKNKVLLNDLPQAFDQEIMTAFGKPVYITHWKNSRDEAVVVNGARISSLDKSASNGLVNISDGALFPSLYKTIQDGIAGDENLSFFNAAIVRSGIGNAINTGGTYTIFAPQNSAFISVGILNTDSIYKMDPTRLKTMIQAHIVKGRNFVYDYILKADASTNIYNEQTLDNNVLTIKLIPDYNNPGRFTGVNIINKDNDNVAIMKANMLTDNGIVHRIGALLKKDF